MVRQATVVRCESDGQTYHGKGGEEKDGNGLHELHLDGIRSWDLE